MDENVIEEQRTEIERLNGCILKYAETLGNEQRKSAELQKQVDELENRFENKAHCNMSENCSMVQQAVKDTAKETAKEIIKMLRDIQRRYIRTQWSEGWHMAIDRACEEIAKSKGVEVE